MTKHIRQRRKSDCGIAAVAMFTGLSYEKVYKAGIESRAYRHQHGTYGTELLMALGYHYENYSGSSGALRSFRSLHLPHAISPKWFAQTVWGRPALLSVPSLNNPGGFHFVYYDGHRVYDPQDGRKGKKAFTKLEECEPRHIIVWQH